MYYVKSFAEQGTVTASPFIHLPPVNSGFNIIVTRHDCAMFYAPRPASLPHLLTMIDNIGHPPDAIAKHLDLSPSTVRRYITEGQAPRPVMLSLYWESTWGVSAANCAAINDARRYFAEAQVLKRQIATMQRQISTLEAELDRCGHSANSPFFSAR